MTLKRGDLFRPKRHMWVGDPSEVKSPVLYSEDEWPAIVLDDCSQMGESENGSYLFRRILLASGKVVEVYPSILIEWDDTYCHAAEDTKR